MINGDKVTLAVIYYPDNPDNQISFHGPEACLGGIGYSIMEEGIKDLKFSLSSISKLQVKWLHSNRNHSMHHLLFFVTNNFIIPNYLTFRWQIATKSVKAQTNKWCFN